MTRVAIREDHGINPGFGSSGTDLAKSGQQGSEQTVLDTLSGHSGVLSEVECIADNEYVAFNIALDGTEYCSGKWREGAIDLYSTYGCCGKFGFAELVTYDTVNHKFIHIFHFNEIDGGQFSDRCVIKVKNCDVNNSHKASVRGAIRYS